MLFNSLHFVFFLPVVLLAVGILPVRWRNPFLLAASYYFYGSWDWRFLTLLVATTCVDYWAGRTIDATADERRRRFVLGLSIAANLGVLGFFKYFNFFVDSARAALAAIGLDAPRPLLDIVLPVGISFYTFQSMSYTIDIYRREMEPARSFWDFALYVAFFPQLVAGPIERATTLLPQLLKPAPVTADRVNVGLMLMLIGFTKKVLIADSVAPEVDRIFADPGAMSAGELLRGGYLFVLQIYCDFAGYSDIARGVSELFGVRLMVNFNQPYLTQSLTEFWRCWHISLSTWLRDYLYLPLGGSRRGTFLTYRNLMITWLLAGLWHGANWTYVAWGGLNGLVLAIERALGIGRAARAESANPVARWSGRVARMVWTFHIWVFVMIVFRCPSFAVAIEYYAGLFRLDGLASVGWQPIAAGLAVLAIDIPQRASGEHVVFLRLPWWAQSAAYAGLCLGMILYGGGEVPFIYFQF